jgi:polysaccharide deacetylase family protein (PEP-CTERM system associated)
MIHAMTIDVEDYWSIFSRDWLNLPNAEPTQAVVENTKWYLEILAQHDVKATFFILGEVAQKFPALVAEIHQGGHEIGVHGFLHKQVFKLTPDEFKREVSDCKKMLEDLISDQVYGHRAPAFSIMPETKWALDVLCDAGFQYDSSIFPIAGSRYGWPGFSKEICSVTTKAGQIIEAPMTTLQVLHKSLPIAGGGYLRHFPYCVNRIAIRKIQKERPVIVYMHPYEIENADSNVDTGDLDAGQAKKLKRMHRIQLRNRHTMKPKIEQLLMDFEFTSL